MKLIPQWRRAWQMFSIQVAGIAVVFGAMPADTQAAVLDLVGLPPSRLPAVLGVLMIIARLVSQPRLK